MNPIAVPKTLRYEPDAGLPVAIEAKSNRRYFYPSNGDKFGPKQTNVIRMNLNANSFLDFSHSYLQFTVENTNSDGGFGGHVALDRGVPFFNRLQIMSGGQELEDIQEYSRLYSMLNGIQGSRVTADESSLTHHRPFSADAPAAASAISAAESAAFAADAAGANGVNAAIDAAIARATNGVGEGASYRHSSNAAGTPGDLRSRLNVNSAGGKATYNIPIVSAFFNIDKYFPLLLTEQGIDLYFYLEAGVNVGCWAGGTAAEADYQITEVKYIAHEVNLDDAFVNQMKASMQATGGVLSLSSTTYRYNNISGVNNLKDGATSETINIASRVKSLKGMLVRPQASCLNNSLGRMCVSQGQSCGIATAQFRIGSVLYPQSAIQFNAANKGELFNEIRKCFGTIGSYAHGTSLNNSTFTVMDKRDTGTAYAGPGTVHQNFLIAYDFETFAKSATESGINIADRALPLSLELTFNTLPNAGATGALDADGGGVASVNGAALDTNQAIRYDCFSMCDCIIYIDLTGKITTRI